jgi:putative hydrolase of the HAD superfamily
VTLEAVLFDLDDTLLAYRTSPAELLAESFDHVGVDPLFPVDAYFDRYDEFREAHDDVDDLRAACFAALAEACGADPELGRRVAAVYADRRDQRDVRFLPGAEAALRAVRDHHGLAAGLVTNGARSMQTQKLDALGLDDAFDTVVYAGDEVPPKPDPEPFRTALSSLGVAADRAVHVGNSMQSDVAGAHAAGVRSVWVPATAYDRRGRDERDVDPHHELESLDAFPTVLDSLLDGSLEESPRPD